MNNKIMLLFLSPFLLVGCLMPNFGLVNVYEPVEYKAKIKARTAGTIYDEYVVNKSYAKAVRLLKKQSNKCLNKNVVLETCFGSNCTEYPSAYRTTIIKKGSMTSLILRDHTINEKKGKMYVSKKGSLSVIVDLHPLAKRSYKVISYLGSQHLSKQVPAAIKDWLTGKNYNCPNLILTK